MLDKSFYVLPSMAQKTHERLVNQGIISWHAFLRAKQIKGISKKRKQTYNNLIKEWNRAFLLKEGSFFSNKLSAADVWMLYEQFKDSCAFIDIETTGYSSHARAELLVFGLYDGCNTKLLIKDVNMDLDLLYNTLKEYQLLVTFNGRCFDVPFLERVLGKKIDLPVIDLRFLLPKIGYSGGLKQIEQEYGIERAEDVQLVEGKNVYQLWRTWKATGDDYFLDLLAKYNEEDCINLRFLMDFAYKQLAKQLFVQRKNV